MISPSVLHLDDVSWEGNRVVELSLVESGCQSYRVEEWSHGIESSNEVFTGGGTVSIGDLEIFFMLNKVD